MLDTFITDAVEAAIQKAIDSGKIVPAEKIGELVSKTVWMSVRETADYIGVGTNFVRMHMLHISYRIAGSDPRFDAKEVDEWVRQNRYENTSLLRAKGSARLKG